MNEQTTEAERTPIHIVDYAAMKVGQQGPAGFSLVLCPNCERPAARFNLRNGTTQYVHAMATFGGRYEPWSMCQIGPEATR